MEEPIRARGEGDARATAECGVVVVMHAWEEARGYNPKVITRRPRGSSFGRN